MTSFRELFRRLGSVPEQSRAARAVELYGWLLLLEGGLILIFPDFVASLLRFAPLQPQASNFLRLAGVLVAGIGMLYTKVLNAEAKPGGAAKPGDGAAGKTV